MGGTELGENIGEHWVSQHHGREVVGWVLEGAKTKKVKKNLGREDEKFPSNDSGRINFRFTCSHFV